MPMFCGRPAMSCYAGVKSRVVRRWWSGRVGKRLFLCSPTLRCAMREQLYGASGKTKTASICSIFPMWIDTVSI